MAFSAAVGGAVGTKMGKWLEAGIDEVRQVNRLSPERNTLPLENGELRVSGESGSAAVYSYDGVKQASEYLQSQGVPRLYRKKILESFDVKTIKLQTAGDSTYGLRFYGGNASSEGRYLFETFSPLTNRQNLALPYEWNSMIGIQQFQVRSGTTMITGNAAAQQSFGSQYIGGAEQWYVNDLEDLIK